MRRGQLQQHRRVRRGERRARVAGERGGGNPGLAARRYRPLRHSRYHYHGLLLREVPNTANETGDRGGLHKEEADEELQEGARQDQRQGDGRDGSEAR